ncbi:MAG: chloramphenicol acetyltransferase [Arcobacter sp.]|nr:chloramphenicol acetyltransferase [Arcobacter sp.]|tara:strand:- start:15775 stop:16401 length:627 start_codon:yes stop_codon:yes gene_type:complete
MKYDPNGVIIHDTAKVRNSDFGVYTYVDERGRVTDSYLGDYSYILHDSEMIYTTVGKFCAIAPFVRINPGNHPYWRPAMANFTYRSMDYGLGNNDQNFFDYRKEQKVTIGNDVWIGQNVLIMPGCKIGNGVVIGGGTIVTKDVEDYSIIVGNPGRVVKKRFRENIIKSLLKISWWNWSREQLEKRIEDLRLENIDEFCKKYDTDFNEF